MIEDGGLTTSNLILRFGKVEHPNCGLHILWAIRFPPTSVIAMPTSIRSSISMGPKSIHKLSGAMVQKNCREFPVNTQSPDKEAFGDSEHIRLP